MAGLLERIAIVGPTGQLGSDLMRVFADRAPIGLEHRVFDLEHPAGMIAALERHRPTLVINTAAYHNVDLCELNPDRALAVNALGVDALAGLCALAGAVFATISSDYVFAGTAVAPYRESDMPAPLNVYGISKLAGELLTKRHGARHFIFRTSGLFGKAGSSNKGYTFIDRMLASAKAGAPVRVVTDMTFSPSYTLHVAAAIRRIVETETFGLYHVTNSGSCTWHEFTAEAFRQSGLNYPIEAISTASFAAGVKRPMYSPLAHGAIEALGIEPVPDWKAGIASYLAERAQTATR